MIEQKGIQLGDVIRFERLKGFTMPPVPTYADSELPGRSRWFEKEELSLKRGTFLEFQNGSKNIVIVAGPGVKYPENTNLVVSRLP